MKHYLVTHIGAELNKRFLAITKLGNLWASSFQATRFNTMEQAQIARQECGLNTRILWVDESHPAKWGEVHGQYEIVR